MATTGTATADQIYALLKPFSPSDQEDIIQLVRAYAGAKNAAKRVADRDALMAYGADLNAATQAAKGGK